MEFRYLDVICQVMWIRIISSFTDDDLIQVMFAHACFITMDLFMCSTYPSIERILGPQLM